MLHVRVGLIIGLLAWLLFGSICTAGDSELKVAAATDDQEKNGLISMVAARAPYFMIFDKNGHLLETVVNPYTDAESGAGSKTVNFLAEKEVTVIIAGRFGRKMKAALKGSNITYIEQQGTVIDKVKEVTHVK